MNSDRHSSPERLLTCAEAAKVLGTFDTSGERFVRRLIAERRIAYVKLGRHVRIPESALGEFIAAGAVPPLTGASVSLGMRTVA
jgi:excisionase family DNA binding protein